LAYINEAQMETRNPKNIKKH